MDAKANLLTSGGGPAWLSSSRGLKDLRKLGLGGEEAGRECPRLKEPIQRLSLSPSSALMKKGATIVPRSSPIQSAFLLFLLIFFVFKEKN